MFINTTCPYCGVGCGVSATPEAGGLAPVAGDPGHPANQGRLCVKGAALHETLGTAGRLLRPQVRGREVGWDQALDAVADGLDQVLREHGPDAVGFYLSGQLLTEDYYVANKLAKGFIGTPHVDTNSRLCMSSAVAAHKRAFGADGVPACYEDLELADLLVIVGANPAWNHPVLYQRMRAAARDGRRVVVIDPRRTATCELADLHLPLKPGSDGLLFNGLLAWLADHDALDQAYLEAHTEGFAKSLAQARADVPDWQALAQGCDLPWADIERFFRWFADTPRTVTFFSQGINQSSSGTNKGNAIINAHLATGRVGRPGASPFSITGQPNAMGGREVGGLANQLAAHLDYHTPGAQALVRDFWQAPRLASGPGLKAVDLFEAVDSGRIKAIWIIATNPVVSLPDADRVRRALDRCPLVIVSDCVARTDTLACADILLPAAGWSEKDGTVTNSERCISRQRALLPAAGEARPDWWILQAVAGRLGYAEAFAYPGPAAIFREHAALTRRARELDGDHGVLDLDGLSMVTDGDYDGLAPIQWPVNRDAPAGRARLFGDGRFCTATGRARLVPVAAVPPRQALAATRPLRLNTGRLRDQWHTMTRTGRVPRLLQHRAQPLIELHPRDAEAAGLGEGQLARLHGHGGHYVAPVHISDQQRPGEVFCAIHWNGQFTGAGRVGPLLAPVTDPHSGQPEFKQGVVALEPLPVAWHARLLVANGEPAPPMVCDYWACTPLPRGQVWFLAGSGTRDWPQTARDLLGGTASLELQDPRTGLYRAARTDAAGVQAVLWVSWHNRFPDLDWLGRAFAGDWDPDRERTALLAGSPADTPETGAIVCTCHQVGQVAITAAITEGCRTLDALGQRLKCGTQCGSCVPELKALMGQVVRGEG